LLALFSTLPTWAVELDTDGDGDIKFVEVTAQETVQIDITTYAGTGYEWSLSEILVPDTLLMREGPIFIPDNEDLPGSKGITRFLFQVSSMPLEEFSIHFQLKRSWEIEIEKSFSITFVTH
jgi:predicted secreted protein